MACITVGVPFYNCETTLAETIRSVFAQSFEDWELILLDDGSSDKSLSIAQSVNDPRVRVISDGVNKGIGTRRAEIVDLATGEYIAWQDADDLMHPDRLEIEYNYMEKHPEISIVDAWTYRIDVNDHVLGLLRHKDIHLCAKKHGQRAIDDKWF